MFTAWTIRRALVVLIAAAGLGVLLYPGAATWFSDRAHAATVGAYVDTVHSLPPARIQEMLQAAHDYNEHLPAGPLQDPYSASGAGRQTAQGAQVDDYLRTLDVGPESMMGVVAVPSIGVSLPIFHGTAAETLDRGVGHLYGTALPVGGAGTHSVLTGHSGIVGSTLFTNLHKAKLGDEITVTVLDQTLTYRVDQIKTVLPSQTESLAPTPGKDYLTLVTCTPIGVNSHRLLVRGVRVPPAAAAAQQSAVVTGRPHVGFPWWALEGAGGLLVLLLLTSPLGVRRTSVAPAKATS
ncbi:class C sortase [Nocardioides sp. Iso805N]|uniref:class C sortase n=1 Tax=Nocardioides sp. Iso805N TaxID=1283287 RepID=UPI0003653027|nr:class C sortase [Nocardioides sp. Iso805N]